MTVTTLNSSRAAEWRKPILAALIPKKLAKLPGVVCEGQELVGLPNGRSVLLANSIQYGDETVVVKYKNGFVNYYLGMNSVQRRGSCPGKIQEDKIPPLLPTTYMIRNIPTRFTSITFIRLLEDFGFGGTFDFFYLPMDFRSGKNMGYAFINFREAKVGKQFALTLHLRRLPVSTSKKVIEVAPSRRQGLMDNVALFRTSDLLNSISLPHYKPLIATEEGLLVPLSEHNFPPLA